ncbi:MAG: tetratricopeptide repeat protein [Acidimicrobiia bacterium]|nr:tetratricopeptide repeat protein [Acidimicrobiia bacterium]
MRSARVPARVFGLLLLAAALAACGASPDEEKQAFLESGNAYAAEGKWAEAVIAYRNALRIDNTFGEAHARLAAAYLEVDPPDLVAAARERLRAAELLPDSLEAQVKAAEIMLLAGRFTDAFTYANKALQLDPKNVDALLIKGGAAAQFKDLDGAVTYVQQAIRLAPDDARPQASLGAIQLGRESGEEAEEAFKQALALDPNSRVANMSLAGFYWLTGRMAEAEPLLERLVELDPDDLAAQEALATFYRATGRPAQAAEALRAIAARRGDAASGLALADHFLSEGLWDEAEALLEELAVKEGAASGANLRLAALDFSRNEREEAHRKVDGVLAAEPEHVDALLMKARFLLAEVKLDAALEPARAAVKASPNSAEPHYVLGAVQARRGDVGPAIASFSTVLSLNPLAKGAELQLVELRLREGSPDAVRMAREGVQRDPDDPLARTMLARVLMLRGDLAEAELLLRSLLAEHDGISVLHTQLGVLRLLQKNTTAARQAFDRALAIEPGSFEALRGRLEVELAEGNASAAQGLAEAHLRTFGDRPDLLLLAARAYAAGGDVAQEEDALRRVLDLDASSEQAFLSLARLYAGQRRLDHARTEFEALARRDPSSVIAPTMVAVILEAQRKPDEARKIYEEVLAATPTAGIAANNLAMLYVNDDGNLDTALQLAQTAKLQLPDSPYVNDTLGWIYYKKDLVPLAIPAFEAAVQAEPANPEFLHHLGLAHARAGNRERAVSALTESLKVAPDYHQAADVRRALADVMR